MKTKWMSMEMVRLSVVIQNSFIILHRILVVLLLQKATLIYEFFKKKCWGCFRTDGG